MRKKRFYKNVKRNQKWTEEVQGRRIDFADKYADGGIYSDKFDYLRPKKKSRSRKIEAYRKLQKVLKLVPIIILCLVVLNVGYAGMGVYMKRHAMPQLSPEGSAVQNTLSQISLQLKSEYVDSVSLDGSVMLDSVMTEVQTNAYNSIAFDIKRSDGSIGFKSGLVNADAYGAVAFPATDLKGSADILTRHDILAVGVVCCYLDDLAPRADTSMAILDEDGELYEDSRGNAYLDPNSEFAYNYIRDIIAEAYDMGITVFVLRGVDLPKSIAEGYADGFEALAQRLYADIANIKLIEAVEVDLDEDDLDDISETFSEELSGSQVYFITSSADKAITKEKLEEGGISSYILADQ